jgi:O-antigen/teichoic acid export membrane protein
MKNNSFKNFISNKLQGLGHLGIGSVLTAAIPILAIPILSRIFDPETYGVYVIFLNCILLASPIVSLQLEHMIYTFRSKTIVRFLTGMAVLCIPVVSLFAAVSLFALEYKIDFIDAPFSIINLLLIYFSLLSFVLFTVITAYLIFICDYKLVKKLEILRATATNFVPILLYFIFGNASENYLLFGFFLGNAFSIIFVAKKIGFYELIRLTEKLNLTRFFRVIKARLNLISYSMGANLLNFISIYSQVILVGMKFGALAAGIFSMGYRVVMMPVSVFHPPIYRFFLSKLSDINERKSITKIFFTLVLIILCICLVVGLLFFYIIIPYLHIFLGEEWSDSASIMYPILLVTLARTLSAPFSGVLVSEKKQKVELLVNSGQACGVLGSLYISSEVVTFAYNYSIIQSILYMIVFIYYVFLIRKIGNEKNVESL